jgi:hypothetical protein
MTGRPHHAHGACPRRRLILEYLPRRDAAQRLQLAFGLLMRALADQPRLGSEPSPSVPQPRQEESS